MYGSFYNMPNGHPEPYSISYYFSSIANQSFRPWADISKDRLSILPNSLVVAVVSLMSRNRLGQMWMEYSCTCRQCLFKHFPFRTAYMMKPSSFKEYRKVPPNACNQCVRVIPLSGVQITTAVLADSLGISAPVVTVTVIY